MIPLTLLAASRPPSPRATEEQPAGGWAASASLPVFILYEDASAGWRAMRLIARLNRQLGNGVALVPKLWRFDLLGFCDWGQAAAQDAAAADLFVIATGGASPLPPAVGDWIGACLAGRKSPVLGLVTLFGPNKAWSLSWEGGASETETLPEAWLAASA